MTTATTANKLVCLICGTPPNLHYSPTPDECPNCGGVRPYVTKGCYDLAFDGRDVDKGHCSPLNAISLSLDKRWVEVWHNGQKVQYFDVKPQQPISQVIELAQTWLEKHSGFRAAIFECLD